MKKLTPLSLAMLALALVSGRAAAAPQQKAGWGAKYELDIDFEIAAISEPRYRRPFVAVWIEDAKGNTVRTLSVWSQVTRRGYNWVPNLKRWYRSMKKRSDANTPEELTKTYSSATRPAGRYSITWDGLDDNGKPVKEGEYTVCIEAAREHGTYQLMKKSYAIGSKPFWDRMVGNTEIKGARIEFRKR